MTMINRLLLFLILSACLVSVYILRRGKKGGNDQDVVPASGHIGRHLLDTGEETEGSEEEDGIPEPVLLYNIVSPGFPFVDGGEELLYQWQLNHRVEREHTAVVVSCEVDIPWSTFNPDSVDITLSSFAFELNETRLEPLKVEYKAPQGKVLISVDLSVPLWVNSSDPYAGDDCGWTQFISCYETDFTDCVFLDLSLEQNWDPDIVISCMWTTACHTMQPSEYCVFLDLSPEQNWDPEYCHQLHVDDCIPHNATNECYYVNTEQCLEHIQLSLGTPELTRCNLVYNTTCAQGNDRGLLYGQYDWTRPTSKPLPTSFEKDLCNMTTGQVWVYEETIDDVDYIADLFLGTDMATGCTRVRMAPKNPPEIVVTTYNPYADLPMTDKYLRVRDCLSVNTSGYYTPPPKPIIWEDFNLTISFTGVFSNYVLVNQMFTSNLVVNITQLTKPELEQLTNKSGARPTGTPPCIFHNNELVNRIICHERHSPSRYITVAIVDQLPLNSSLIPSNNGCSHPDLQVSIPQLTKHVLEQLTETPASLEYEVTLPAVHLSVDSTFSERGMALKHEKINHRLWIYPPHAIGFGLRVTVTLQDPTKMIFLDETPTWSQAGDMVKLTEGPGPMYNQTHDMQGGVVTLEDMMEYMTRAERPVLTHSWVVPNATTGRIDALEVAIPPLIGIVDGTRDVFFLRFSSRVLTTVITGDELKLPQAVVVTSDRGRYRGGHPPKLTVTDQPFLPLITAIGAPIHPDTGDNFELTFDLSQNLEFSVFDIWMNISCPEVLTVSDTLSLGFLEPVNITTDSDYDEILVLPTSLHFHLTELAPGTNFLGNQTFHMWDNALLTHQSMFCQVYLSYRREGKDLVLPYESADIEVFTLPGIVVEVYEKELLENTTMYEMAIGSNATFVVDIEFPETSTELEVTLTMPDPVMAVYSSFVTHNGTNLAYNGTDFEIQPMDDDTSTWPMDIRTIPPLQFGLVINHADNQHTFEGDHLVFEFNCVLRDTATVLKDTEHALTISVSYSGSPGLEQQMSVSVLEPEIDLMFRLTNKSLDGDPGDVFEYNLFLSHTEFSQTPAHHVVISFYLPYMGVYRDFTPSNESLVPVTTITEGLGIIEADSMLDLYVPKLEMYEYITGTFLIKISTKLTEGIALMATANFSAESFYQWGRLYLYTAVSENLIDIRNATLYFMGTSQPQTGGENVTIHEQVTYRLYIPLPPIDTNLTLLMELPQRSVTMLKWEAEKLRSEVPRSPPMERTFYQQGCLQELSYQECYCHPADDANETVTVVLEKDDARCVDVPKTNCTTWFNETASAALKSMAKAECEEALAQVTTPASSFVNCTGSENCTLTPSTNSQGDTVDQVNCSAIVGEFDVEHELCDFLPAQVALCKQTTLEACQSNPGVARKWPFAVFYKERVCRDDASTSVTSDTATDFNCTDEGVNCTIVTWVTELATTIPPELFSDMSTLPSGPTSGLPNLEECPEYSEYSVVNCTQFAEDFCAMFVMKNCSDQVFALMANSSSDESDGSGRSCFCNDVPEEQEESSWVDNPYHICEGLSGESADVSNATSERCSEVETVSLSVAEVIHTEITSTREGAVCHFVGGNRYNPFTAGVTYFAENIPANDTDVGDSVSAFITMVILDDETLSRGEVLTLEGTSIFSYVSYPVKPPSVYRENCTCSRLLIEYTDPDALIDCSCDTANLHSISQSDCNFTSTYTDTDAAWLPGHSCGCVSYCSGEVSYFENPLGSFNVMTFDPPICDCAGIDAKISDGDVSFLSHVAVCGETHLRNYTCDTFNVTVTHETAQLTQNCSCVAEPFDLVGCFCDSADIASKVGMEFSDHFHRIDGCENGTLNGDRYELVLPDSACSCALPPTESPQYCICSVICEVEVEEDSLDHHGGGHDHHVVQYHDNLCECQRVFVIQRNVSAFLNWVKGSLIDHSTTTVSSTLNSSVCTNESSSSNLTLCGGDHASVDDEGASSQEEEAYSLNCFCYTLDRTLTHVPQCYCREVPPAETFDSECFVPPDNATQFILDNWDENATIIDQMVTTLNHNLTIVEPELQVTFIRHPEPSIVDRIDQVAFDFEVTHTDISDAPAFHVHLLLDAVNFTRNSATGILEPTSIYSDEHCSAGNLCQEKYSNSAGLFRLPHLPVDPPGVVFRGTFNLSVGNEIDFVADSLLTAAAVVTYDSCIIDFDGRPYGPINASDTVQVDAPTISAFLAFSTAYSHMFFSSVTTDIPQVFSVGDYVRVRARLWVPEVTLWVANLTISSDMVNVTVIYGEVFLTDQIWNRNDTGSIYQELATDEGILEGLLYYGLNYTYCSYQDGGVTIVPGVVVNDADNVVDGEDYLGMTLTFRVNDVPSWTQGEEIHFVISATYRSDYYGDHVTLVDESVTLMMVEPKLSLRVEILDHQYLLDQITNPANYTCEVNTCCEEESCGAGETCLTDVGNKDDCSTVGCLCYSGYATHEKGGCTAVGRTSGDIVSFGITATHDVDFTGNAFDVIILVHSSLPSSLLPEAHFISHPPATDYLSSYSVPVLTQPSADAFKLYIKRFTYVQACERFSMPFRVDPTLKLRAGEPWHVNASLSYYSAKPYDISMELNRNSRFYEYEGETDFVFHAPAPSSAFYMMPTQGNSTEIDFRVYSSSNESHTVTINLARERTVRFQLEVVIPKVETNLSIMLSLPTGDGFTFLSGEIVYQGGHVEVGEAVTIETTDLDDEDLVYIPPVYLYSTPDVLVSQRPFNGTIQRQFKTMLGETQPYPTEPSCSGVNSTLYESPLVYGCFNDSDHLLPVAMVTEEHPTNGNHTLAMTNPLCFELCRQAGYYISGTKNGSDCYCGNHTNLGEYQATAGSISRLVNSTVREPIVNWVPCNATRTVWINETINGTCSDEQTYQGCVGVQMGVCGDQVFSECTQNFMATVDCGTVAAIICNGSLDLDCESVEEYNCSSAMYRICSEFERASCDLQSTNGSIHATCTEEARAVSRLEAISACQAVFFEECYTSEYWSCYHDVYSYCFGEVTPACEANWEFQGFPSMEECVSVWMDSCMNTGVGNCQSGSEATCRGQNGTCVEDMVATSANISIVDCRDAFWEGCSACLYEYYLNCTVRDAPQEAVCEEEAVEACLSECYQQNCTTIFYPVYEEHIYPVCSSVNPRSSQQLYPSNCSVESNETREVHRTILKEERIPLTMCDVPCSGDANSTCGGESMVLLSGILEQTLVEQQCDWYAGLYEDEEDTVVWEFELEVDALATKGVIELLQPLITYTHGPEQTLTLIPFAPFRLEAGRLELMMNVWVSPKLSGYVPGGLIEYYTEVRHHPTSTITARDVTVWWIFPTYVEFVNLTNHEHAQYEYHSMQPVTALSTNPSEGITFYLQGLENTDMMSFHFLVRLDPDETLPAGEYNMVAFAEMDYFSWDIYNPHEDDYRYNTVPYYHDPELTRVEFEVKPAPITRVQREDVQLKTYSFLYDEDSNIFYACYFNRTGNRKEGGCFMTGDLLDPLPDPYPTCEGYCNCTFESGIKDETNCSDHLPRPGNCTCGCYPDCEEDFLSCEDACLTCQVCNTTTCSGACQLLYDNCTTSCCEGECSLQLGNCIDGCDACDVLLGCTVQGCIIDCEGHYDRCYGACHPTASTCEGNCTTAGEACSDGCVNTCQNHTSPTDFSSVYSQLEVMEDCIADCQQDCVSTEVNCTEHCCIGDCGIQWDFCSARCMSTCASDTECVDNCTALLCNASRESCFLDCALASASCNGRCELLDAVCREDCPVECHIEVCTEEVYTTCEEGGNLTTDSLNDVTMSPPGTGVSSSHTTVEGATTPVGSNPPVATTDSSATGILPTMQEITTEWGFSNRSNGSVLCTTGRREVCTTEHSTACNTICVEDCSGIADTCTNNCCSGGCSATLLECRSSCQENCSGDGECYKFCNFSCEDDFELCMSVCYASAYRCKSDCELDLEVCGESCLECQALWNRTDGGITEYGTNVTNVTEEGCSCNNQTLLTNDSGGNLTGVTDNCTCNTTEEYQISGLNVSDACSKSNMSECMASCNSSLEDCHASCPCEETCHLRIVSCWESCAGCHGPCYDLCHDNCGNTTKNCTDSCAHGLRPMVLENCLDSCRNVCVSDCVSDNGTANGTCLYRCSAVKVDCTLSCLRGYLPPCPEPIIDDSDSGGMVTMVTGGFTNFVSTGFPMTTDSLMDTTRMATDPMEHGTTSSNLESEYSQIVMSCVQECQEDSLLCINATMSGDTPGGVTSCLESQDSCTARCMENYTSECCSQICAPVSESCAQSCTACDGCLVDCKHSCDVDQGSCLSLCGAKETRNGSDSVDCDGYAACMLACPQDGSVQECTAGCLGQHVGCSSIGDCSALDVCVNSRRRRRRSVTDVHAMALDESSDGLPESTTVVSDMIDSGASAMNRQVTQREVTVRRRRRDTGTLEQNTSGDGVSNYTEADDDNCTLQYQFEDYLTCRESCSNGSMGGGDARVVGNVANCLNGSMECDKYTPTKFTECLSDCELTLSFCEDSCQNCSHANNCSCFCDICSFGETDNVSECLDLCSMSMFSPNCSASCDRRNTSAGLNSWDCDCSSRHMLTANGECGDFEWTNGSCLSVVDYQLCSCNCGHQRVERTANWRRMHKSVGNILGSVNGTLYGLSRNGMAVMVSVDYGDTWSAIADGAWTEAESSAWFNAAQRLDGAGLSTAVDELSPEYTFMSDEWAESYRVSATGIHYQQLSDGADFWETLGIWTCCEP